MIIAIIWALLGMASFVYWYTQEDIFILNEDWTALIVAAFVGPIMYVIMWYIYAQPAHSGPFRRRLTRLK